MIHPDTLKEIEYFNLKEEIPNLSIFLEYLESCSLKFSDLNKGLRLVGRKTPSHSPGFMLYDFYLLIARNDNANNLNYTRVKEYNDSMYELHDTLDILGFKFSINDNENRLLISTGVKIPMYKIHNKAILF